VWRGMLAGLRDVEEGILAVVGLRRAPLPKNQDGVEKKYGERRAATFAASTRDLGQVTLRGGCEECRKGAG
jgi:hypothetical protein